ncbi:hypothetical protein NDU88_007300 [Pleurodeles waltl]|uniref:Uncharacterized protein n=1 Tax=Pleurodeles waltl TaxID=8319 RepID=A0AAV7VS48_PLEWA|nr:hypothetical protein NDU88_007300 [Pleurodeles waltl]
MRQQRQHSRRKRCPAAFRVTEQRNPAAREKELLRVSCLGEDWAGAPVKSSGTAYRQCERQERWALMSAEWAAARPTLRTLCMLRGPPPHPWALAGHCRRGPQPACSYGQPLLNGPGAREFFVGTVVADYNDYLAKAHNEEDRPKRLLAWLVASTIRAKPIPQLLRDDGLLVYLLRDISETFRIYYEHLYCHPGDLAETEVTDYLNPIHLKTIDFNAQGTLGGPVTAHEILVAIKEMPQGKNPSPNGLPVEFYTAFSLTLTPELEILYAESFKLGLLPKSTKDTLVTPLSK